MQSRLILLVLFAVGFSGTVRADDAASRKLDAYRIDGMAAGMIQYAQLQCGDKIKGVGSDHERDALTWLNAKRSQSLADAKEFRKVAEATFAKIKPDDFASPFDYSKAMDIARSELDADRNFASQLATAFDLERENAARSSVGWSGYRDESNPCAFLAKTLPQIYSLK